MYACSAEDDICFISEYTYGLGGWHLNPLTEGNGFDYDNATDLMVVLINESSLAINGQEYDLSDWLDEDIVELQWMPSLFYNQ
jgi:hypothetical protein